MDIREALLRFPDMELEDLLNMAFVMAVKKRELEPLV